MKHINKMIAPNALVGVFKLPLFWNVDKYFINFIQLQIYERKWKDMLLKNNISWVLGWP
jgi:hypothetical protein